MSDPSRYGKFYWCAKVPREISKDGEIYLMADDVCVVDGCVRFIQKRDEAGTTTERVNFLIPAGKWHAVFAASVLDGSAVAVEHWKGEIAEGDGGEDEGEPPGRAGPRKPHKRVTKSLRYAILKRDGFRCQACGATQNDGATLEVDHKTPESMWGDTTPDNLQTLCRPCNRGKGTHAV